MTTTTIDRAARREWLKRLAAFAPCGLLHAQTSSAQTTVTTKPIPSTGEQIPLIGLGSWITFNVGNDRVARDACADVMRAFFDADVRWLKHYGFSPYLLPGLAMGVG